MYNLIISNGYWIVKLNEGKFLIDTGYPWSISFNRRIRNLNINNINYPLNNSKMAEDEMLNEFNMLIDGIIGNNILNANKIVEFNKETMTASFGKTLKKPINYIYLTNDFMYEVKVNGISANAYLDTGAHICMVDNHSLLNNMKYIGEHKEGSFTGVLTTSKYEGQLEFNGNKIITQFLKSVPNMMRNGSDLYFGLNDFTKKYCVFDFEKGLLYFE